MTTALAGICAAAAVAGCAGSKSSSHRAAKDGQELVLARCMRANGAPNFPDPTQGSGGEGFSISSTPGSTTVYVDGIPFRGPAFESAVKACKLFGGGTAPPPVSASQKLAMITFARCMREHGIPNFPDPSFSGGGVERNLPAGVDRESPAFKRAFMTCRVA